MKLGRRSNSVRQRSPSPSVYSYGAGRPAQPTPERFQPSSNPAARKIESNAGLIERAKKTTRQLPMYISLLLILASFIYIGGIQSDAQIIMVQQDNTVLFRSAEAYQKTASELIGASTMNRSKITIDTNRISSEMQKIYPELKNVVVIIPLISRRPIIQLQSDKPAVVLTDSTQAFVINADGKVLMRAADAPSSSKQNIPIVNDNLELIVEPGKMIIPRSTVSFMTTVTKTLRSRQVFIQSISLPTALNEIHVRLEGEKYYLKFNLMNDARQQVGTYLALKNYMDNNDTSPSEYVDLRVDERAYYK